MHMAGLTYKSSRTFTLIGATLLEIETVRNWLSDDWQDELASGKSTKNDINYQFR